MPFMSELLSVAPSSVETYASPELLEPNPEEAIWERRLRRLNEIGLALSSERDINVLLEKILTIGRDLTGADAGSLFLVQEGEDGRSDLYFCEAQNDSIPVVAQRAFAVSPSSLAGYVALTGKALCFEDVYELSPDLPYKFNPSFDKQNGYRTKSLLVVPLINRAGDVLGVLQLLNSKRDPGIRLTGEEVVDAEVLPFDQESVDLAGSLASQAAVALENTRLLASIQELFESFVQAASTAIEDRDPSTSGHSRRVTKLTLGLANAINDVQEGRFADVHFSEQDLKELRYAGLLHDFGKIGVREWVLTKSHKLEPRHFELVMARLALVRKDWEMDGRPVEEINALADMLERANDPQVTFLPDPEYVALEAGLKKLASLEYRDARGNSQPVVTKEEVDALSIRKGSLTRDEYRQIQEHAELSYQFLSKIAWTSELKQIPAIAHAHHEKLNGKGYPLGLTSDAISLQSKLMTVSDIYDALTAADRPYKKAMPVERAISILREEVKFGGLDADIVELFVEREIWKLTQAESQGANCAVSHPA